MRKLCERNDVLFKQFQVWATLRPKRTPKPDLVLEQAVQGWLRKRIIPLKFIKHALRSIVVLVQIHPLNVGSRVGFSTHSIRTKVFPCQQFCIKTRVLHKFKKLTYFSVVIVCYGIKSVDQKLLNIKPLGPEKLAPRLTISGQRKNQRPGWSVVSGFKASASQQSNMRTWIKLETHGCDPLCMTAFQHPTWKLQSS